MQIFVLKSIIIRNKQKQFLIFKLELLQCSKEHIEWLKNFKFKYQF